MAVFMLQLAEGVDDVVEARAAGRTKSGEIVLESVDERGNPVRIRTYRPDTVTAVFRRGPGDSGSYGWIPQPASGTWWCY
ncbi:hypothetical protein ACH4SP_25105 [Streptomyces sp. NPDC021093]|uniref:hypothetical protein n=1 Tax=Streptomyces sp. NPDC021093 TaxID=3365112 RepID=UPI0037A2A31A